MKQFLIKSKYNTLERNIGWTLFIAGGIILAVVEIIIGIRVIADDQAMPVTMKISIVCLILGAVLITISFLRERLFKDKKERYKDIDI